MADYPDPSIPLQDMQAKVVAGLWHIRREAQYDAIALGLHLKVREALLALTKADFHKSMDAEEPQWHGCRQDVYKPLFEGMELYLKFQVWPQSKGFIFVVSFKEQ